MIIWFYFPLNAIRAHNKLYKFANAIRNYMLTKPRPHLGAQIKLLRDTYFPSQTEPRGFWGQIIKEAEQSPGDLVKPIKLLETLNKTSFKKKFGLISIKGESLPSESEMTFDQFADMLTGDLTQRAEGYKIVENWILSFPPWRAPKTLAQIARFEARRNVSTPWGEQTHWEQIIKLRRLLEGWRINPTEVITAYPDPLDEDSLEAVLCLEPTHPLSLNPQMIPWFLDVNGRAYNLKRQKLKIGRKRVTTTEAVEQYHKQAEYATFFFPWIKFRNSTYTTLEAVEIAYYGRTHRIDPDLTVTQFRTLFTSFLSQYESTNEELSPFPRVRDWNESMNNQLLNDLAQNQEQYAKSLGIMFVIHQRQEEITELNTWKQSNIKRGLAQQHPLDLDEWRQLPHIISGAPRVSWYTGRSLPASMYHLVSVENSLHPDYRKIMREKNKNADRWTVPKQPSTEEVEEEEKEQEVPIKCDMCGEESAKKEFDTINIHKSHHSAFYSYAHRYRRGAGGKDQTSVKEEPLIVKPPDVVSEASYKRKFESLLQTVRRWGDHADDEIVRKVKAYNKRKKIEEINNSV